MYYKCYVTLINDNNSIFSRDSVLAPPNNPCIVHPQVKDHSHITSCIFCPFVLGSIMNVSNSLLHNDSNTAPPTFIHDLLSVLF